MQSDPFAQLDGDDITYRERINMAKVELFSIVIHENLSIPNRIRRDGDDVIFYFKNRDTIDKVDLSKNDKIDILEQIYNLALFLEANDYQLTELSRSNICYGDDKVVRIHDLQVNRSSKANNDKILSKLWKELGRPIMRWRLTDGRYMKHSFIIDDEECKQFLDRFSI